MVLLDVVTGLRASELFGLKWTDIDFRKNEISVTRSIVMQVVGPCKTEASQKPVPLDPLLARTLRTWRAHTKYKAARPTGSSRAPTVGGRKPYWYQSLMRNRIREVARRARHHQEDGLAYRAPAVSALGEQSNILQRRRTLERRKDCAFGAGVSTRRIPSTSSASLSGHDKSPSNPALYLVFFLHAFPPGVSCKWRGDILPPACARPGFASRRAGRNPDDPVSVPMRLRPSSGNFNPIRRRHRSCCSGLRPGGRHHRGYSRFNSR